MKRIKFDHHLADLIRLGEKTSTWRIYDDKDIGVGDCIELIDKVDPSNPDTWLVIGVAIVGQVSERRLGDITAEDYRGHQRFASGDEMLTTYRHYYGPQVTFDTSVKIVHFRLLGKNSNDVQETTERYEEIKLFSDGGSRGNPGPSACGYVLLTMEDQVIAQRGIYLGVTTNNQAEYQGLKYALEEALRLNAKVVHVHMDSMLVVNQMKGTFNVKNRDLWPIHNAIKELVGQFSRVTFVHVPRELNKLADSQVNDALNAHTTDKM